MHTCFRMARPSRAGLCSLMLLISVDGADKQSLVVRALSYTTHNWTSTTPAKSQTNCSPNGNDVNCSTTYTPARENVNAIEITNVVEGNGQVYTIHCTRWAFGGWNCLSLVEGHSFEAVIEGKTMSILAHKNGGVGKAVRMKTQIISVGPSAPPQSVSVQPSVLPTQLIAPAPPVSPIPNISANLPSTADSTVNNEDILRLKSSGFTDDFVVKTIKAAKQTDFHVAISDLVELREKGVSEAILGEMLTAARRQNK